MNIPPRLSDIFTLDPIIMSLGEKRILVLGQGLSGLFLSLPLSRILLGITLCERNAATGRETEESCEVIQKPPRRG